ncbi:MAG: helix-turn-helix transcriptional regulator [Clostridia bacterium]|nr:helix-turn-helix transcriptional regulator [Clostridia bacterium]
MIVIRDEEHLKKVMTQLIAEKRCPMQVIADFADVTQSTISNWLAGRRVPSSGHLIRVLDALGVDLIFRDRRETQ